MNEEQKNSIQKIASDPELKKQFKRLVLERINVMPETLRMAVGSAELTKEQLTKHVQDEDEIGNQVMEIELGFLKDLASGAIYRNE